MVHKDYWYEKFWCILDTCSASDSQVRKKVTLAWQIRSCSSFLSAYFITMVCCTHSVTEISGLALCYEILYFQQKKKSETIHSAIQKLNLKNATASQPTRTNGVISEQDLLYLQAKSSAPSPPNAAYVVQLFTSPPNTGWLLSFHMEKEKNGLQRQPVRMTQR